MKIKYFDRADGQTHVIDLPVSVDVVEIQIAKDERIGPYSNVELSVHVNTDAVIFDACGTRICMYQWDEIILDAQMDGIEISGLPLPPGLPLFM